MAIPDALQQFVKEALAGGHSREAVERALLEAGWEREQVRAGLAGFAESAFPIPVPRPVPYLSAREAFLYLLMFTALYLSAFHFGQLLFQFIAIALPDPAASGYERDLLQTRELIRWSVATLIVAFPLFLYLARLTGREVQADPAKRASKVRRWLTYLTLFIAATVVMGDLIVLLKDLLGGELTLRFMLKALVVGGIAGTLFGYYLGDIRRADPDVAA